MPHLLPIGLFALVGPAVGVAVFFALGHGGAPSPAALGLVLLFGYGIGVVPALMAGVLYVVAWGLGRGVGDGMGSGLALGAICGGLGFAAFALVMRGNALPHSFSIYLIPLLAGAVCGALAAPLRARAAGSAQREAAAARLGEAGD